MHLMRYIQRNVLDSAMPLGEYNVHGNVASALLAQQMVACIVCLL